MLERNNSSALGRMVVPLSSLQLNYLDVVQQGAATAPVQGPMSLPQGDQLGHQFADLQGRNVAAIHWAGQPVADAVRELRTSLTQFWDDFEDGSMFDLGPEVNAAADRVAALYPDLFKATAP